MSCYSIPALSADNEFLDLAFVGRYADSLVASSGDLDYAIVYEWDDNGPGDWPPVAVLARINGGWHRRQVLVSVVRTRSGACKFDLELEGVNGH
jgi:hypothetical protein